MSSASIPAERWYGGPKLRNRPSNLNERRSRPNSRRVSSEEYVEVVGEDVDPLDDPLGHGVEVGDLARPDDERVVEIVEAVAGCRSGVHERSICRRPLTSTDSIPCLTI